MVIHWGCVKPLALWIPHFVQMGIGNSGTFDFTQKRESIHIYPYLSISIHIYPYLSISIHIYPYLSIRNGMTCGKVCDQQAMFFFVGVSKNWRFRKPWRHRLDWVRTWSPLLSAMEQVPAGAAGEGRIMYIPPFAWGFFCLPLGYFFPCLEDRLEVWQVKTYSRMLLSLPCL